MRIARHNVSETLCRAILKSTAVAMQSAGSAPNQTTTTITTSSSRGGTLSSQRPLIRTGAPRQY